MGDSNGGYGEVAQYDDEFAEVWDAYDLIPEPGTSILLDEFVARKHLTHGSLVRLGARMPDESTLAFAFDGGIKYRNLLTDKRWSASGSSWHAMKIVQHGPAPSEMVFVAEGESDAAWLSDHLICDVAILPAGANPKPHTAAYVAQLSKYSRVVLAQDSDRAGNEGAQAFMDAIPSAVRLAPEGGVDWCEWNPETMPLIPEPVHKSILISMRELRAFEAPLGGSWFENAILPVGGSMIIHGWAKSFKSFLNLDIAAALAQGTAWAGFENEEEPCKVVIMQYEIPLEYFQQRVNFLYEHAKEPDLFDDNLFSWGTYRPSYRGGDKNAEDIILQTLLDNGISVFCLDPVRRAMGAADLNSEKEVRPLLDFYSRLNENGITVITCHHDNKTYGKSGGGDPLGMTGAGAFAGDFDSIVSVSIPKGETMECRDRNLNFTLRNAPNITPRGFTMTDAGILVYSDSPYGRDDEPTTYTPQGDEPSI